MRLMSLHVMVARNSSPYKRAAFIRDIVGHDVAVIKMNDCR